MPLIYITGVPGTGKSTVCKELLRRGHEAYGGAEDNIAAFYNNETDERLNGWVEAKDRTPEWKSKHTWKIARETIEELKAQVKDKSVFLCAVTRNDVDELWDLFDKVITLTIDEDTLKRRLATRTNNDVGKTSEELASILERQKTAKERYESLGAVIVDSTEPVEEVVDEILSKVDAGNNSMSYPPPSQFFRTPEQKKDMFLSWTRDEMAFFGGGACHILAYLFYDLHRNEGYDIIYTRPLGDHPGNHVYIYKDGWVFDCAGWTKEDEVLRVMREDYTKRHPNWDIERMVITDMDLETFGDILQKVLSPATGLFSVSSLGEGV